jgi:hypothetical protein
MAAQRGSLVVPPLAVRMLKDVLQSPKSRQCQLTHVSKRGRYLPCKVSRIVGGTICSERGRVSILVSYKSGIQSRDEQMCPQLATRPSRVWFFFNNVSATEFREEQECLFIMSAGWVLGRSLLALLKFLTSGQTDRLEQQGFLESRPCWRICYQNAAKSCVFVFKSQNNKYFSDREATEAHNSREGVVCVEGKRKGLTDLVDGAPMVGGGSDDDL